MARTSETARWYETIMSVPGMNENVKMDVKMPRKTVLLLHALIETGLNGKGEEQADGILQIISPEMKEEIAALANDWLERAGLKEVCEKLKVLNTNKA